MIASGRRRISVRDFVLHYGFYLVLVLVFAGYSVAKRSFFTLGNVMDILHAASPLMIVGSGLSLVIISRSIDISVGSISFLCAGIGVLLMVRHGVSACLGILIIVALGALLGALNGFIVVVLKINPLITTLSTMLAFRGLALQITRARVISLPEVLYRAGSVKFGPVYLDTAVALAMLLLLHILHTRTKFGRHVTAIGNGPDVAARVGVRVPFVTFLTFVISGLLASIGGIFSMLQVGAVTSRMGLGMEFTAMAVIIIGGISLFGGEGRIIPGLVIGAGALTMIENGLYHLGASPFAYPLVRGVLIFVAMYADSLRSLLRPGTRVTTDESRQSVSGAA